MKFENIDFDEFKAELEQCDNKVRLAYYNLYGEDLSIEEFIELSSACAEVYNEPMIGW